MTPREIDRRNQLERSLFILAYLADLRLGATLLDVVAVVESCPVKGCCERTIRRDLLLLERMGYIDSSRPDVRLPARWKLNPITPEALWNARQVCSPMADVA